MMLKESKWRAEAYPAQASCVAGASVCMLSVGKCICTIGKSSAPITACQDAGPVPCSKACKKWLTCHVCHTECDWVQDGHARSGDGGLEALHNAFCCVGLLRSKDMAKEPHSLVMQSCIPEGAVCPSIPFCLHEKGAHSLHLIGPILALKCSWHNKLPEHTLRVASLLTNQ